MTIKTVQDVGLHNTTVNKPMTIQVSVTPDQGCIDPFKIFAQAVGDDQVGPCAVVVSWTRAIFGRNCRWLSRKNLALTSC
ncbi:MAG: hypothetical protein IPO08_22595 [Xanthomonadales bacterium]|nr:hypothetical protein [Xanthomonadales bacterium]